MGSMITTKETHTNPSYNEVETKFREAMGFDIRTFYRDGSQWVRISFKIGEKSFAKDFKPGQPPTFFSLDENTRVYISDTRGQEAEVPTKISVTVEKSEDGYSNGVPANKEKVTTQNLIKPIADVQDLHDRYRTTYDSTAITPISLNSSISNQ